MSANGVTPSDLTADIERIRTLAEVEIQELTRQLVDINDRLKYLRRVVSALSDAEKPSSERRPQARSSGDGHASQRSLSIMARAILAHEEEKFAGPTIMAVAELSQPTVYTCLKMMRTERILGLAGTEQVVDRAGKKSSRRNLWRVLDPERLKELADAAA